MATQPKYITSQAELNVDQQAAIQLTRHSKYLYTLFHGGAGSGKSFLILYVIILRALYAPGSRHLILRSALTDVRRTIWDKDMKTTFEKAFPGLYKQCKVSESELHITLPNGSVIFCDGLNDEARVDKVLGDEFHTVWFNECNQFNYEHVSRIIGRMRSAPPTLSGPRLAVKVFADCNPNRTNDWEYKAFIKKVNPIDGNALPNPEEWVSAELRTQSNLANVGEDYIDRMSAAMSAADRARFVEGRWRSDNDNALFDQQHINDARIAVQDSASIEERLAAIPDLKRIVIGVDPSVSNNKNSDETGIVVAGTDGERAYVLADGSRKGTPEQWAQRVSDLYHSWRADRVIAEKNNGGLLVETTLRISASNLPIKLVHASKGKDARAEPISALYERGLVHHVGRLDDLERQMTEFGSRGAAKSPDRMDALVWAITELMNINNGPSEVRQRKARGFWR